MSSTLRGADIVMRTLEAAGCTRIFTLSGNHIMSLFDAAIGDASSSLSTCARRRRRCIWPTPGGG